VFTASTGWNHSPLITWYVHQTDSGLTIDLVTEINYQSKKWCVRLWSTFAVTQQTQTLQFVVGCNRTLQHGHYVKHYYYDFQCGRVMREYCCLLFIDIVSDSDWDSVYWTCSQKAKNQKAKQTIMHCTTKQYSTIQEMKWNAMQCSGKNEPRIVI